MRAEQLWLLVKDELFLNPTAPYLIITWKQSFLSSLSCSNFITFTGGKIRKANLANLFFSLLLLLFFSLYLRAALSLRGPPSRCFVTRFRLLFNCRLSEEIHQIARSLRVLIAAVGNANALVSYMSSSSPPSSYPQNTLLLLSDYIVIKTGFFHHQYFSI